MAGIYGMNFENMPELHTRWGYPILLAAMVAVAAGMIVYFYRKGWLGGTPPDRPDSEA
jgi:magnesium transporter